MQRSYSDFIARKRREYGERFSETDLVPAFRPFFENGARIELVDADGNTWRGRIGVTTGWRPAFILLFTKRSRGSWYVISERDTVKRVVAV